ncbi:MAG: hypothetical protein DRH12_14795 [Deltaproteobacteria bacterium]|nr:MAG: hypothetical protein DRH12_14795 [Deltaproteobacteria bacterium]
MLKEEVSYSREFGSNRRFCFERISLPPLQAKGSNTALLKLHLLFLIIGSIFCIIANLLAGSFILVIF